jgi:hypothetical protein
VEEEEELPLLHLTTPSFSADDLNICDDAIRALLFLDGTERKRMYSEIFDPMKETLGTVSQNGGVG